MRSLRGRCRATQLQQLYALCLDDAAAWLGAMRAAAEAGDDGAYRKERARDKGRLRHGGGGGAAKAVRRRSSERGTRC